MTQRREGYGAENERGRRVLLFVIQCVYLYMSSHIYSSLGSKKSMKYEVQFQYLVAKLMTFITSITFAKVTIA